MKSNGFLSPQITSTVPELHLHKTFPDSIDPKGVLQHIIKVINYFDFLLQNTQLLRQSSQIAWDLHKTSPAISRHFSGNLVLHKVASEQPSQPTSQDPQVDPELILRVNSGSTWGSPGQLRVDSGSTILGFGLSRVNHLPSPGTCN